MITIARLDALEILDSRGKPTLSVTATLSDGSFGQAHVPSGASTGRTEALELRDGDPAWYAGAGVTRAAHNVEAILAPALLYQPADALPDLDRLMIALDGTESKQNLGANAILGVSCSLARALAEHRRQPLWQTLAACYGPSLQPSLPVPMVNILSGGLHSIGGVEFQDFLVIPRKWDTFREALHAVVQVHRSAREVLLGRNIPLSGVADEGGWGPRFESNEAALQILTESIEKAGFRPGEDVAIAIDAASAHFHHDGQYRLASHAAPLSSDRLIDFYDRLSGQYPIVSLEDGLDQEDWAGWSRLTERLGHRLQLIGDDLFTTNTIRLARGVAEGAANAVLVKMNQIGTLYETFQVLESAVNHRFRAVVSARSGETEDSFLADLAVASGAGQIKIGSITRSERLAKYNRLLQLEANYALPMPSARTRGT